MTGKLLFTVVPVLFIASIVCASSKNPVARLVGGIIVGVFSLGSSGITAFLLYVGFRSNWSSDGPGMLMVMIGVVFFGVLAVVGWGTTAKALLGRKY